ncbi:rhomboid family protein [[Clostridium] polysaccharolyticum]|uniref:Membrane associated serine protease, rhomboid family n=1 Tax=[Clostridium] polysaccharolyticum TaxID=29364 RepID=A0A1I0B2Q0_9FIRM|nr:hypothetical protein [[Clostridium] polysaccharolyticum]SET00773.1 hypothetical protein SAMN04487772_106138 [[Clostridium] polysaccharolyticum]
MKFINKLERKYRKYAVPDLIKYFMFVWVISTVFFNFIPYAESAYYYYCSLDFAKIFRGQVWRLVTFIILPYHIGGVLDVVFFAIQVMLYTFIGRSLERAWGAFRFNLFFISGVLFNILGGLIYYLSCAITKNPAGSLYYVGMEYLFQSMFFAFAVLYPDVELLLYYIIPVKMKYLAILDGVFLLRQIVISFAAGAYYIGIAIIVAMANFLIFYFATRNYKKYSPRVQKRKVQFKREVSQASTITRHKCAVCGRTEKDGENLEFRYCSKCKGNLEYCQEHLFTHEHVK